MFTYAKLNNRSTKINYNANMLLCKCICSVKISDLDTQPVLSSKLCSF